MRSISVAVFAKLQSRFFSYVHFVYYSIHPICDARRCNLKCLSTPLAEHKFKEV